MSRKRTLTFDNGPSLDGTPGVLDVLALRDVRSTFVCGRRLASPSALKVVERARAEGHRIGNHTFSHSVELGNTGDPGAPAREIGRTQDLLGGLADEDRLFRPYGAGVLGPHLLSPAAVEFLSPGARS